MKPAKIEKYMTPMPHTINSGMTIKTAKEMMKKFGFRHLPVQVSGHLVGVLTERDIKLASNFPQGNQLLVDDLMTPDPYAVSPQATLEEVVQEMAEHKYGCAVVQQVSGKVVGIFTATDGLRAFGKMLINRDKPPSGKRKIR